MTLASMPVLFLLAALFVLAFAGIDLDGIPSPSFDERLRKIYPGSCDGVTYHMILYCVQMFRFVVTMMFLAAVVAAVVLYAFSRVFIVVESFISLRHVPIGVYEGGLGWSKYIPHL